MDQEYFDRVYESTYRSLLKHAIIHLSDPTDAEDALQNVYFDFYRRVNRRGHLDVLLPRAFLMKMLRREIAQHYAERAKRDVRLLSDLEEDQLSDDVIFEDVIMDRALAQDILEEAKRLPKESYRVFVLYYGYELSLSEIAKELNMGLEAVKSRLFRARNTLRRYLTEDEENAKDQ